MRHLHEAIAEKLGVWRFEGYAHPDYPAVAEILDYAWGDEERRELRYLRTAQFRALETYWYLRLVAGTPKIPALYESLFPKSSARREALGLHSAALRDMIEDEGWEGLYNRVRTDEAFVRKHKLESLRETLTLDYPSYILALAMGAGKTILMGTIVATEFAMAQEYPEGGFVQNALIFAPGKTIIESLREIADMPFERILPPRMYRPFAASLKLTFTRDGEKDLPIVRGSSWNVVVTNTEKIRIQKPTGRRGGGNQFRLDLHPGEDPEAEIANLRLQAIASLPHLAVFSDEAHHTYGQKLLGKWQKGEFVAQGIKKVRRTVDYLAENTNFVVAVNTTGTPYFERQPLKDVVIWYGLGEGIRDGVLKEVARNVKVFDMDEGRAADLVREVVDDFVRDYWKVKLPDGAPARLALYFPSTQAVAELRPHVEAALAAHGLDASAVLEVNNKSTDRIKSEFYRVAGDPASPYRVILLVNMGTEGWNCPSLFACALVRKLKSSNNFVLQAATRCLRQVSGNEHPARIYLARANRKPLESQLVETYGTSIQALNERESERVEKIVELKKPALPPLLIKRKVLRFRRKQGQARAKPLVLEKPDVVWAGAGTFQSWQIVETTGGTRLQRTGVREVQADPELYGTRSAASWLAANYHLPSDEMYAALTAAYGGGDIPEHHLEDLGRQIEKQRSDYETYEETVDVALALVKPEGFTREQRGGKTRYTARVSFAKDREHLYKLPEDLDRKQAPLARAKSFHYEGYNFDSEPEAGYLAELLTLIEGNAEKIEGAWFTGGITDPAKTDLYAEYLGEDGRWHRYTPDFVIRRRDGKHLIVEVKKDSLRPAIREDLDRHRRGEQPITPEGRKAVALQEWETLNPDRLHYEVIFADAVPLPTEARRVTQAFLDKAPKPG